MVSARLIKPTLRFGASHASFVAEFLDHGEELVPWVIGRVGKSFLRYVDVLEDYSRGVGLPEGFPANSTFWLVDDWEDIVAVSNLRHGLNGALRTVGGHIEFGVRPSARRSGYATEILRQTLLEAKKLGVEDVLLTCDEQNVGSVKAIVRNGAELVEKKKIEKHSCALQRYRIEL